GAKETRNPNTHFASGIGILSLVHGIEIPRDELSEMLVQFSCDDKLIQLLPNGGVIKLVSLHDAVDGPEDVTFKQVLDEHCGIALTMDYCGTSLKAR
ncbi:hypothetical protein, partial [Schlesneria sp.]|uniref:hypothetical protein n=1 Tax=Schlesneria sp. TaxID=2762018 RepID=UPI002EF94141